MYAIMNFPITWFFCCEIKIVDGKFKKKFFKTDKRYFYVHERNIEQVR